MALSLLQPNGATYHIIGEQAFHNDAVPPWCHCVVLSFPDGQSQFTGPQLAATRFELRGDDAIPFDFDPINQSVTTLFYTFIQKQPGWTDAVVIDDAAYVPPPDDGEA